MNVDRRLIEAVLHLEADGNRLDVWSLTPPTDQQRP